MHIVLVAFFLGAGLPFALTGCVNREPTKVATVQPGQRVPIPGELRDYAGHPCGNPYAHVKIHPCVFPQK